MKSLDDAKRDTLRLFSNANWVRWIHEGSSPAYTPETKTVNIVLSALSLGMHCPTCLNLNGCCFPRNNMPEYPLHPNCHCTVEPVNNINFVAECSLAKFSKYIFVYQIVDDKKGLFESWGYQYCDSEWLKNEYEKQAKEKYALDNFTLESLSTYGQKICIEITLPRKDKLESVTFKSIWMVYPDGEILLVTPYGGKI
ncbi:MAG: hypothetical protein IK048_03650 [Clostridia bacterium]|nr:hypothetical protein [Clostridia bacterium]